DYDNTKFATCKTIVAWGDRRARFPRPATLFATRNPRPPRRTKTTSGRCRLRGIAGEAPFPVMPQSHRVNIQRIQTDPFAQARATLRTTLYFCVSANIIPAVLLGPTGDGGAGVPTARLPDRTDTMEHSDNKEAPSELWIGTAIEASQRWLLSQQKRDG